jgi:hypothetical protein
MSDEIKAPPPQTISLTFTVNNGDKILHELFYTQTGHDEPKIDMCGNTQLLTKQLGIVMSALTKFDSRLF